MDAKSRWENRYASIAVDDLNPEPAAILADNSEMLPAHGSAIDIAGGTGRNALWLAERGLDATLLDISPTGLDIAKQWADRRSLNITAIASDVETDGIPSGPWHVAVITLFYVPEVVMAMGDHLAPGGLLLFAQPTLTNLERHERPSARFLLDNGEVEVLAAHLASTCDVVEASEGWRQNGVHEARLIARKF